MSREIREIRESAVGAPAAEGDDHSERTVLVSNRQDLTVDEDAIVDLATRTLVAEGVPAFELSVSLVGLEEMEDLHVRYMEEEGPTDVLSFPLDGDDEGGDGVRILGDVVICPAYAVTNDPDLEREVRLLLVHGILHLLGHDHEDDGDRAVMWAKQERHSGVAVDATGSGRGPGGPVR